MTKNSSSLRFMAIFMSYCPQFWSSRTIYMFERYEQRVFVFASYGRFHVLCPTVLGFQDDFHVLRVMTKKSSFSALFGGFHELLPIVLGFQGDLHVLEL